MRIASRIDDRVAQFYLVGGLGCRAAASGESRLAAQLFWAYERLRAETGASSNAILAPLVARATEEACAALGRTTFEAEFQAELAVKNVTLDVTPACAEWLARKGYSQEFGAREIARLVSTKLKDFFVDEILFGRLANGGRAQADVKDDDVVLTVLP